MKIFSARQIREIDKYTIKFEPVKSIDLMERAAGELFRWITANWGRSNRFVVFAGPGNNGGDGLALTRMLAQRDYVTEVHYIKITEKVSPDWEINRKRLESETSIELNLIDKADKFPVILKGDIIIDAIFGSGLTRSADGLAGEIINRINKTDAIVISIDLPSGLFCESNTDNDIEKIINADFTLSFQFPKLSFLFAENYQFTGEWVILPIGLNETAIQDECTSYTYIEKKDLVPILRKRRKFDHKGHFGHGLLIAGSYGKMGAAILGAEAALRTGMGLLTCHVPRSGNAILQCALPEAMVVSDINEKYITDIGNTESFSAVGVGPGLGTQKESMEALFKLLTECKRPMVIDADALNILSLNRKGLSLLPEWSILTPHPKEFERLTGSAEDGYSRLKKQMDFSEEYRCIVVLKGANTSISTPAGKVFFNSSGNNGMATAGCGDALTGIILSLLAQGYSPENAAVLGVWLHGCAGDIAVTESSPEAIIASDVIKCIGKAFNVLRDEEY